MDVLEVLAGVLDPEFGLSVVDLGLIYGHEVRPEAVEVTMTLTTAACPLHETIVSGVKAALEQAFGRPAQVVVVWEPAWSPERISPAGLALLGR